MSESIDTTAPEFTPEQLRCPECGNQPREHSESCSYFAADPQLGEPSGSSGEAPTPAGEPTELSGSAGWQASIPAAPAGLTAEQVAQVAREATQDALGPIIAALNSLHEQIKQLQLTPQDKAEAAVAIEVEAEAAPEAEPES